MHPATSLILFTVLSGLGFGLIAFLGAGVPDVSGWVALTFCALALILAGAGLAASTFHLGNPQRAWRALTQWRSSWLSREGVLAAATMAVFALYAALWSLGDQRIAVLGWVCSGMALATVVCTAMIYAQLRTVPRWRHWSTPTLFLAYALAGGAALSSATEAAALLMVAAAALQVYAWTRPEGGEGSTPETATGLGRIGTVRLLEPPHSGPNYLMREMVFVVARKRARALRAVALGLGLVLPALILWQLEALPAKHAMAGLAVLSHIAGMVCQRWLFFAEARHAVGLYYGQR